MILFVAIFYTVATWAVSYAVGPDMVQQAATDDLAGIIFGLASTYVGPWLDVTMQVLVVSSFIAMLIGMQNMFARYGFALARAGCCPSRSRGSAGVHRLPLQRLSPTASSSRHRHGFLLAGADPIEVVYAWFVALGTVGFIVMMALASLAISSSSSARRWSAASGPRRSHPSCRSSSMAAVLVIALQNYDAMLFSEGATAKPCSGSSRSRSPSARSCRCFKKDIDFKTVMSALATRRFTPPRKEPHSSNPPARSSRTDQGYVPTEQWPDVTAMSTGSVPPAFRALVRHRSRASTSLRKRVDDRARFDADAVTWKITDR